MGNLMSQLHQLKKFTKLVIDSADVSLIKDYPIVDATTNPSLILKEVEKPFFIKLMDDPIVYANKKII